MERRAPRSSWIPAVGSAIAIIVIASVFDVPLSVIVRFCLYLLVVAFPGVFLWRLLLSRLHTDDGRPPTWLEDLSLGTIFGFGLQLPLYVVGVLIGVPLLYLVLPVAVLALSLVPWGRRVWTLPTSRTDPRLAWAVAVVAVYGVATLAQSNFAGRPVGNPPSESLRVDGTFHLALITELLNHFPPQVPYFLGHSLDYQWFFHAQVAANHWLTGIDPSLMLQRVMPITTLSLTMVGLAAVSLRLTGRLVAATLAPAILVVGCYSLMGPHYDAGLFTEAYLSRRFVSSPTEAYAFMIALPAIMLILEVLRSDRRARPLEWLALAIALLSLSGSKATFIPVFLCGALGLWVFRLIERRRVDWQASRLTVLLIAVTAFAQLVLFRGNSGALSFAPMRSVDKALSAEGLGVDHTAVVVMTVTMLLGWLLYGVGALGLLRNGKWRDSRALWMLISIPVGIVVPLLLFRSGLSQYWFQRSVAELIVLLSVWGLMQLLPDPLPRRLAVRLAAIAAVSGALAFVASVILGTKNRHIATASYREIVATAVVPIVIVGVFLVWRRIERARGSAARPSVLVLVVVLLGLCLSHAYAFAYESVTGQTNPTQHQPEFARGAPEAGTWVRDHSNPNEVVATNVHCRRPEAPICDNRSFWVAALTERRVVIQGWGYMDETNSNFVSGKRNRIIGVPDPLRLAINDAAFRHPTTATVSRLIDTYDVRFLFVSKAYPADIPGLEALPSLVTKTFENDNYVIFEVVQHGHHN